MLKNINLHFYYFVTINSSYLIRENQTKMSVSINKLFINKIIY